MRSFSRLAVVGLVLVLASAAAAESIGKWQEADGTLYLGNHPPAGSVLLGTFEDAPAGSAQEATVEPAPGALQEAAADGREIIRRRALEREAERGRDLERERRAEERERAEEDERTVIVEFGGRFRHHPRHREPPIRRPEERHVPWPLGKVTDRPRENLFFSSSL